MCDVNKVPMAVSVNMDRDFLTSTYSSEVYVFGVGLVYWGLTPQQQPGSGGEMMMKSVCLGDDHCCVKNTQGKVIFLFFVFLIYLKGKTEPAIACR